MHDGAIAILNPLWNVQHIVVVVLNNGFCILHAHRLCIFRASGILQNISLPLKDGGGDWNWAFLNPAKLLAFRLREDNDFISIFEEALALSPPSLARPWRLLVSFDEFTPGDKFRADNGRKAMVCSFSFLEFGQTSLSSEHAWTTPVVVRSSQMSKVVGGWPRIIKEMLQLLLIGSDGLTTAGIALKIRDTDVLLFGQVHSILSDGDGHRIVWDWRGQGSMTPCLKHYNVLRKDCSVMQSNSEHQLARFVMQSKSEHQLARHSTNHLTIIDHQLHCKASLVHVSA